jgi:hypothetical protein
MNLTDWHGVLATEPATRNQVGAIHGKFRDLGFRPGRDRDDRLAYTAALAGLDQLDSSSQLTQGEAGRVVGQLRECATASEAFDRAWPGAPILRPVTLWPETVAALAVALYGMSKRRPVIPAGGGQR